MKKTPDSVRSPRVEEMRPEYDFSGGIRGKHAGRFAAGTIVVALDPDVAESFPDSKAVNEALRALVRIIRRQARRAASVRRARSER